MSRPYEGRPTHHGGDRPQAGGYKIGGVFE
jgi:hypothetical protein